MTRVPLTGRQRLVYDFIREYIAARGVAPTFAEMETHFGRTIGTLHGLVTQLERRGWITRTGEPGSQRNIALVRESGDDVADEIEAAAKSLDGYAEQTPSEWAIGIFRGTAMKLREIAQRARA